MNISRRKFFTISAVSILAPVQMLEAGGLKEKKILPKFHSGEILTSEKLNRHFNAVIEYATGRTIFPSSLL